MAEDEHQGAQRRDPYEAIEFARKSPLDGASGGLVCPKHPAQALIGTGLWGVATLSKQDVGLAPVYFCVRCHNEVAPVGGQRREGSIRRK